MAELYGPRRTRPSFRIGIVMCSRDLRAVIDGIDEPASVAAVFDNLEAAENFLKTVKDADLGL